MQRVRLIDSMSPPKVNSPSSALGTIFSAEITTSLSAGIFPGTFGQQFSMQEAPLYVLDRLSSSSAPMGHDYSYEKEFINHLSMPNCRLHFIEGREGIGKSTFLRYFFDCYLPTVRQTQPDLLLNTIKLYVDVRRANNEKHLDDILYDKLMRQIKSHFPNISVEDNFAMWRPKTDWDDPLHAEAAKGKNSRTYRANVAQPFLANARVFTECALWYLTAGPGKATHGRRVFLILDNVDQLDRTLQLYLLRIVLNWASTPINTNRSLAPSICDSDLFQLDIDCIIVAIRPETLRTLRFLISPLPPNQLFRLGVLNEKQVMAKRAEHLAEAVIRSDRQLERDIDVEDDDITMFEVITPRFAAERLRRILDFDVVISAPLVIKNQPVTQQHARGIISLLVNGSARRMLDVHSRLIQSRHMEQAVLRTPEQQARHGNYSLVHALLTGGLHYFNEDESNNPIVNLYNACNSSSPFGLLIGVHLLHVVRTLAYRKRDIINCLADIGYYHTEIEDCIERMHQKHFFTLSFDLDGEQRIEVDHGVVDAHIQLSTHPAYIDEMAMVTPVENSILNSMRITTPFLSSVFAERVQTSLNFLEQIRLDQEYMCNRQTAETRLACDRHTFVQRLNALRLPDICKRAAFEYRRRLLGLSAERPGLRRRVSEEKWKAILENPILQVNKGEEMAFLRASA